MITKSKNINRPWLRLLCLCLAMCMLVGMLPAMAIAAGTPKYLYMKPNSNWKVDNARFAAYFFGNGEKWVSGEKVDTDLYKFEVPAGFPNVIFCRMNPSQTANNWNNKWNQTADLTVPTNGNNCYSIKSGTWDYGGGTWSTIATCKYEGHSGTLSYVSGGNGTHTQKYSCCGETYGTAEGCTNNAEYPCYDGNCVHCGGFVPKVPHISDAEYSCQAGSCKVCGEAMSQSSHTSSSQYPCQDAVCTICGIDMPKVDHQWKDATCTDAKTCSVCGETDGEALGHDWVDASCSQPKTCSVCGETDGDVLDHNFIDERCEYCQLDQYVTIYFQNNWLWSEVCLYYWYSDNTHGADWPGTAMEFYGNDGNYDVYVYKIPYNTYGVIVNGIKDDGSDSRDQTPDITEGWYDGICYYMHWDDGNKVGSEDINVILPPCEHIWKDASCNEPETCELCGATSGVALGHTFCAPTCTEPETCVNCGLTQGEALGHSWGNAVVTDPTCTEDGYTTYSCSVCGDSCVDDKVAAKGHTMFDADCTTPATCSVCGETEGEALGHDWDDATCTAPKTCSVCGETEGAVIDHNDQDNNGRCDYCSCLMQDAKLSMASISLKGNIAINYYMLLSDEALADKTAYMQFTLADGEIRQIPVSEGVKHEYYGEIYYVFTCAVDAKEMTDDVLSQFFYAGGSSKEYTYSVQTYADYILTNSSNTKMKALVAAMLNYGAASQIHFNYRTDDLANAGLEAPDYANVNITGFGAVSGQGTELAKLYSASLILKSETTLRFFFRVEGSATLTVTYNGQPLEVMERSGLYYVDIVGISAKDMSESVTVTISDGTSTTEVFFNPMSYCQGVLNDKTGAFGSEMKNLVCALYLYNQAANSYFGEG